MYPLHLKLKQHTPLIHFQYDQENATLRATELKPKLDKFIIKKIGKDNIKDIWKGKWDEKNGITSLNYKVKIAAQTEEEDSEVAGAITNDYRDKNGQIKKENFPTFFALLENEERREELTQEQFQFIKHFLIDLSFQFPDNDLRKLVDSRLPEFFMRHNFGTRQSKGFGSFFPEDQLKYPIHKLPFWFDVDVSETNLPRKKTSYCKPNAVTIPFRQYFELFSQINLFYSSLKSGINQNWGAAPMYFKSMLFLYAKNKLNLQWDKKTIKENFFNVNLLKQKAKYQRSDTLEFTTPKKYLLRDLLGLSLRSDWKEEYNDTVVKKGINTSSEIKRFQSPILFKPIEIDEGLFRVYIDVDQEAINSISDREFEISNKSRRVFKISTPPFGTFNLTDFIKYAVSINLDEHIQMKGSGHSSEKKILKSIYSQIKRNLKD